MIRRYGIENVFFFEKNVEIDFFVPEAKMAIQVSFSIMDDIATKERELNAFEKLRNYMPDTECLLITNSEETDIDHNGIHVKVVPAWKWLLEK